MEGVCFCMSEKIYRFNGGCLLLYVREDIPTEWRESAFVCQRRYTDSMEGSGFVYQRRYTDSMKGVCFCLSCQ